MFGFVGLILIAVGSYFLWGISSGIFGFVSLALFAAVIGYVGEMLTPGERMPGGLLAAIGAAICGSWLSISLLGTFGGFTVLPAGIGAALLVFVVVYVARAWVGEKVEPRVFESAGVITYCLDAPRRRR